MGLKIAVTGKGGTGKTTVAAVLAKVLAEEGMQVLAIDADPDANLAGALGLSRAEAEALVPVSALRELIAQRTGAAPDSLGGFFKMNPRVDDLPDRLSVPVDGVRLMLMGTVKRGEGGCVCPESVLLKTLVKHLLIARDEAVVMDMEAGIEHLGRGTAAGADAMLIVVEPGVRSLRTAEAIGRLAADLGLSRVFVVFNKVQTGEEARLLQYMLQYEVIATLPYSEAVRRADLEEKPPFELAPDFVVAVRALATELKTRLAGCED